MMYFKTSSLKIIRKPTAVSWPAANSCHLLDVSQSPFTAADKPRDLSSHPEVAEASGSLTWAYITVTRRAGYDTDGWGPTPEFLLHFIWAGTHWFAFLTFHSLLSPFVLVTTLWEPLVYIFFPHKLEVRQFWPWVTSWIFWVNKKKDNALPPMICRSVIISQVVIFTGSTEFMYPTQNVHSHITPRSFYQILI